MRNKQLDALRTVAVFLVLGHHFGNLVMETNWIPLWTQIGWSGVDLFFVLSGFLISGLLFREYKLSGTMRVGRFLVRRGMKIYPAYYTFCVAMILFAIYVNLQFSWHTIWQSLLFVQNYSGTVIPRPKCFFFGHLWSVDVEEHFYVLLPVLLWLAAKRKNSFSGLPLVVGVVMLACFLFRCIPVWLGQSYSFPIRSHMRFDGLAFGVLLSYLWEFRPEVIERLVCNRGRWLLVTALILLSPLFFFPLETAFMHTIGLASTAVGYGCLLIYFMKCVRPDSPVVRCLSPLGLYSYTTYLVHFSVLMFVLHGGYSTNVIRLNIVFVTYLMLCFAVGVLFAKLVELPVLKLRDRVIPTVPFERASVPPTLA